MAARAELKARLTLNNSAFMRGMSFFLRLAEGFGRQMLKVGATVVGIVAIGKAAMFMGRSVQERDQPSGESPKAERFSFNRAHRKRAGGEPCDA
jgi:hypothetical protein